MKITSHVWDLDKVSLSFNLRLCFDGSVSLFSTNDMACDTPVVNLAPMVGFLKQEYFLLKEAVPSFSAFALTRETSHLQDKHRCCQIPPALSETSGGANTPK